MTPPRAFRAAVQVKDPATTGGALNPGIKVRRAVMVNPVRWRAAAPRSALRWDCLWSLLPADIEATPPDPPFRHVTENQLKGTDHVMSRPGARPRHLRRTSRPRPHIIDERTTS